MAIQKQNRSYFNTPKSSLQTTETMDFNKG